MEGRKITRKWAAEDASGRRLIYIEELWESAHEVPARDAKTVAAESARQLEAHKDEEAAAPLSRWNLAGAGMVVALMGVYACLLLR